MKDRDRRIESCTTRKELHQEDILKRGFVCSGDKKSTSQNVLWKRREASEVIVWTAFVKRKVSESRENIGVEN